MVSAVVKYQIDFFEEGPKHLKTLTLKQIADEVGIHESTVSRSINGKYMQRAPEEYLKLNISSQAVFRVTAVRVLHQKA